MCFPHYLVCCKRGKLYKNAILCNILKCMDKHDVATRFWPILQSLYVVCFSLNCTVLPVCCLPNTFLTWILIQRLINNINRICKRWILFWISISDSWIGRALTHVPRHLRADATKQLGSYRLLDPMSGSLNYLQLVNFIT